MCLIAKETAMVHHTLLLLTRHFLNISQIEKRWTNVSHKIVILLKNLKAKENDQHSNLQFFLGYQSNALNSHQQHQHRLR